MRRQPKQKLLMASLLPLVMICLTATSVLNESCREVSALSISAPGTTKNLVVSSNLHQSADQWRQNLRYERQNSIVDHQQSFSGTNGIVSTLATTTNIPPLITTLSQFSYMDAPRKSSQTQDSNSSRSEGLSLRSTNIDDHDDSLPLATISNHSKGNGQAQFLGRPQQYADAGALVNGPNRSTNSSLPFTGSDFSSLSASSSSSISSASSSQLSQSGSSYAAAPRSGATIKTRGSLPECATQQVCNAIFVRMNYTQRLCECSSSYNWRCSNNLDPQDGHTIELTRKFDKRIYTQIKTCEPLREVRACKAPSEWTLLALQSERSGKAHYVVVCKCPNWAQLEGPYTHNHPPYANIPGIRVYGMLCAHQTARSSAQTYTSYNPTLGIYPEFPWHEALNVANSSSLLTSLD